MAGNRFTTGESFTWNDRPFTVRRCHKNGDRTLVDETTGEIQATLTPLQTLVEELFAGKIRFEQAPNDEKGKPDTVTPTQEELDPTDGLLSSTCFLALEDYPPHLVEIARYRLRIVAPLVKMGRGKRTKKDVEASIEAAQEYAPKPQPSKGEPPTGDEDADEAIADEEPPGDEDADKGTTVNSVYRWIPIFEQNKYDLRSLIPHTDKRGGGSHLKNKDQIETIISATLDDLYMVPETVTAGTIRDEVKKRVDEENEGLPPSKQLTTPCLRTIQRRIDALCALEVLKIKKGEAVAKRAIAQYGKTKYPDELLAEAEMDDTPADFMVVDDITGKVLGRPYLTYCLELSTRYPLGYYIGIEKPGYLTVMECLYHALCPKGDVMALYPGLQHQWLAYGLMELLRVDNGSHYTSQALKDVCDVLGINLQFTPVKTPTDKPSVERGLGTLNGLFHSMPGTTFSNITERGDYDSKGRACVLLSELDRVVHIWLLDIYAQRPHKGLGGATPEQKWLEKIGGLFVPSLPKSVDDIQVLLGRVEYRRIWHYGIEFENMRYNCAELGPLRFALGSKVTKIKYNPRDLGVIQVYDPFNDRYIPVPSLEPENAVGISQWRRRVIDAEARRKYGDVNAATRAQAARELTATFEESRARMNLARTAHLARFEAGEKAAPADVPTTFETGLAYIYSNADEGSVRADEDETDDTYGPAPTLLYPETDFEVEGGVEGEGDLETGSQADVPPSTDTSAQAALPDDRADDDGDDDGDGDDADDGDDDGWSVEFMAPRGKV